MTGSNGAHKQTLLRGCRILKRITIICGRYFGLKGMRFLT